MKLKLFSFLVASALLCNNNLFAQGWVGTTSNSIRAVDATGNSNNVNVGIGISNPDPNAVLDLSAKNKGLLIPRIKLSKTNQTTPFGSTPTKSMLVYNIASSAGVFGVSPGFYFWNGTLWEKLGAGVIGATGPTGGQGPAGVNGINGIAGTNGLNGAAGPTGEQGVAGVNGANGLNGLNGVTGATGEQGVAGVNGTNGVAGPTGFLQNGATAGNTPYWDGTNWITNNSNVFNNGGNVGIGEALPSKRLHIKGGTSQDDGIGIGTNTFLTQNQFEFGLDDGSTPSYIDFHGGTTLTDYTARIFRNATDDGDFNIINNGAGSVRVLAGGSSGNVQGGALFLGSGDALVNNGNSGKITIFTPGGLNGNGINTGGIDILTGDGYVNSGVINIKSGSPTNGGSGGINIETGRGGNYGVGNVSIKTGNGVSMASGKITVLSGDAGSYDTNSGELILGTGNSTTNSFGSISLKQGNNTRFFIASNGNVGISTTSAPTAVLHTVGTVRFESLPSGVGNVLVADANGNVFVSTTPASIVNSENGNANSDANKKLADQISQQQEIINDLQARLNDLEVNSVKNTSVEIKEVSKLSQNTPNPFNQNTSIEYYVADGANNAVLYIYNMQGQQIKKYVLEQKGKGTLVINGKDLVAGIYHYSLIIDGKLIDTKKMILTN